MGREENVTFIAIEDKTNIERNKYGGATTTHEMFAREYVLRLKNMIETKEVYGDIRKMQRRKVRNVYRQEKRNKLTNDSFKNLRKFKKKNN